MAVRQAHRPNGVEGLRRNNNIKQMTLDCGAERHHYSMFDVGRSMFDVHLKTYGVDTPLDILYIPPRNRVFN